MQTNEWLRNERSLFIICARFLFFYFVVLLHASELKRKLTYKFIFIRFWRTHVRVRTSFPNIITIKNVRNLCPCIARHSFVIVRYIHTQSTLTRLTVISQWHRVPPYHRTDLSRGLTATSHAIRTPPNLPISQPDKSVHGRAREVIHILPWLRMRRFFASRAFTSDQNPLSNVPHAFVDVQITPDNAR